MKFNWSEYNILAQEIIKIPANQQCDITLINHDAILRCAISRAYYSAHCEAKKYLKEFEGLTYTKEDRTKGVATHQWVLNQFNEALRAYPFDASSRIHKRSIYDDLYFLRDERVSSDYEEIYSDLKLQKAKTCTKRASFVLDRLLKLRLLSTRDT